MLRQIGPRGVPRWIGGEGEGESEEGVKVKRKWRRCERDKKWVRIK